jgi:hypothetical protein
VDLVREGGKNPVDFAELGWRQLVIFHHAVQPLAPISARQPGPLEVGGGRTFQHEPDMGEFAVDELRGICPGHFGLSVDAQTVFRDYSHGRMPPSVVTPRKNPRNAVLLEFGLLSLFS